MSNLVKSKVISIIISMIILILIPLFKSNFNAPVTYLKWKSLSWEDFQGFGIPFSGWDAVISSTVYVEYDSTKNRHIAFAAMNNQQSWKKDAYVEPDYLLNHEQYHFNITEYFSRKLNKIIVDENLDSEKSILPKLMDIRAELSELQDKYDTDSDHSLNVDIQRLWEFRVDSLLVSFEKDSGNVLDYYSGATIFFPSNNYFHNGMNESNLSYRIFQLEKYDMFMAMSSFQYDWSGGVSRSEYLKEYYHEDSLLIKSFHSDSVHYDYQANVVAYDSINDETTYHLWAVDKDFTYKITVSVPGEDEDNGYKSIANSILSSFEITDTRQYWQNQYRISGSEVTISRATPYTPINEDERKSGTRCATYGEYKQYGFYGRPTFLEDGSFLLPYNITEHPDSVLHEVMVIHDDVWYSFETDNKDKLLVIPADFLKDNKISLDFGYLLKEDTLNTCFAFYYQHLETTRQLSNVELAEKVGQ